ncbi:MAG TPA: hypothetical protein VFC58_04040 [Desulfosporosinus sp.]|nr:hypothetical protein [Desulfosporosinus sp.]
MDNEKFQELMLDQFAKMFSEFHGLKGEFHGLKGEVQGLKGEFQKLNDSQVRMEDKFNLQLTSLQDFRVSQDRIAQDNKDQHTTFATKIEELQFEARIAAKKLNIHDEEILQLKKAK